MPPKSKTKTVFVCQQCGSEQPKWTGRCPDCGEWNTFVETLMSAPTPSQAAALLRATDGTGNRPTPISQVQNNDFGRIQVPGDEFNRVLGGGIVPGSLILIGGDPGIGKCIVGETRVLDPNTGAYRPIVDYATGTRQVLAVDEQALSLSPAPVAAFHEQGIRP